MALRTPCNPKSPDSASVVLRAPARIPWWMSRGLLSLGIHGGVVGFAMVLGWALGGSGAPAPTAELSLDMASRAQPTEPPPESDPNEPLPDPASFDEPSFQIETPLDPTLNDTLVLGRMQAINPVDQVFPVEHIGAADWRLRTTRPGPATPTESSVVQPAALKPPGDEAPVATGHREPAILVYAPAPAYPVRALRRGQEGEVACWLEVDEKGRVVDVTLQESSGVESLDDAAQKALRTWRFQPATEDGRAVATRLRHIIRFQLDGGT